MSKLSLVTEGDDIVVVTRWFAAPPADVFRAHTEAALLQQWCLGPDGWTMPVCHCDARPGGRMRCEWSDGNGNGFYLTAEFLEVEAPHRILHVERMHLPDPTPDNRVETTFTAERGGTLLVMRMQLPDRAAREMMLATGMAEGMEASYDRLERSAALR